MKNSLFAVLMASLGMAGCAIHPLPEDVTRDTTSAIVKKIRCEGRQALDNLTADLLRENNDPVLASYASEIEQGSLKATDLFRYKSRYALDRLSEHQKRIFLSYTLSAVTFDFQFMITETNDNNANFDLSIPLVSRVFAVNGQAQAKFQRQNTRKFFVTNSFWELHDLDKVTYCGDSTAKVGNVIYRITGKIGLEEVFRTFIDIDSSSRSNKKPEKKEEFFNDNLLFTTTLFASVTPKITLNPVTNPTIDVLRVPNAQVSASAIRVDGHQVAISLARGDVLTTVDKALQASLPYYERIWQDAKAKTMSVAQQNRVNFLFINQREVYNRLNINSPYGY